MAWTTPETFTSGQILTAASMNIVSGDLVALANNASTTLTTTTTTTVTTAGTFYDISGLSVSITPNSTNSKILVLANVDIGSGADLLIGLRLVRGSTAIGVATSASNRIATTAGAYLGTAAMGATASHFTIPMMFLDAPASVSAQTYKVQGTTNTNSSTLYVNRSNADGDNINSFRATSTITVMEFPA
jgi:hypothetical protein